MEEITKITITSTSGYCMVLDAYKDRLTISPDSIRYACQPEINVGNIKARNWFCKTNSRKFGELFRFIAEEAEKIMNSEEVYDVLDAGECTITATYTDKTRRTRVFYPVTDDFGPFLQAIQKMVPKYEDLPEILRYLEDED